MYTFLSKGQRTSVSPLAWPSLTPKNKIENRAWCGKGMISKAFSPWEVNWRKVRFSQSCPTLCNPMDYSPWNSLGVNAGVGSLATTLFTVAELQVWHSERHENDTVSNLNTFSSCWHAPFLKMYTDYFSPPYKLWT